ncbi:PAS domain S-box protein [Pseudomonas sp. PDM23]|uniref:hybrid sensor histidine kinase/response regulator n=1 Tax=unclassified Pseudomonas TaxID=196821 RepID=UPI0017873CD8|nr:MULTISPECIES: PAS domain-containing sensor histidine kinase [unclassified Pseudomonas]MBD9504842.1 PAS domain S-box protein [Pseudomonas sp. PDM17]MBD9579290.1 PAS domain S-box protein [Pseudomonas sp. PDM23]MBD9672725.1 PAS domain S-box protein [Pseudomonas sp. PDM21]
MPDTTASTAQLVEDARYRLLVEAVTDYAIYMLDPDGRVSSWSSGAQRLKGYAADEILGEHFSRFYTPADREAGLPELALGEAARVGRFESEGWRLHRDGSSFWAHVVIDAIRDVSGELLGFAKITRDRTEQHETEQALRRSEQHFRLLVNGVTDYALYMLDPEGNVTSWNSGAERIKGYHPEEIIGRRFDCFYCDEDRQGGVPETSLSTALAEGRYEEERLQMRKDGSRFWANIVIDPVFDDAGKLLGFAKITRDITDKRRAQEELERARDELIQSQKMESLGQLTGGVAHDFNNLLTVILGGLQLLERQLPRDNEKVQNIWRNALEATRRGAQLTQRMLAFARKQRLFPQPIQLPALLQDMSELLVSSLGPTISLETRFPLQLDCVMSDQNQLELAIINLATNARDAMPGGGSITFSARNAQVGPRQGGKLAPGEYVCLAMTDSGLGMDEDTLRRAAEPFFTTKPTGKGTGLGLSIVHGLAQQQGGALLLRSTPGQGTTAEIWLPAVKTKAELVAESTELPPDAVGEPLEPLGLRVLVVDDDALVLAGTSALLADLGCQVARTDSARAALQWLEQSDFDLMITDFAMPDMDGMLLIQQVRQSYPALTCVLTTGYAGRLDTLADSVVRLPKPFDRDQLLALLLQVKHVG